MAHHAPSSETATLLPNGKVLVIGGIVYDPVQDEESSAKIWIKVLQSEEARLSTHGKQIVVSDSGHMIPFGAPDAAVAAIRAVRSAVLAPRNKRRSVRVSVRRAGQGFKPLSCNF